jgi:hypothetical protein
MACQLGVSLGGGGGSTQTATAEAVVYLDVVRFVGTARMRNYNTAVVQTRTSSTATRETTQNTDSFVEHS